MIYDEIINEYGFDPGAEGPADPGFSPWSVRGALEMITGVSQHTSGFQPVPRSEFMQRIIADTTKEEQYDG